MFHAQLMKIIDLHRDDKKQLNQLEQLTVENNYILNLSATDNTNSIPGATENSLPLPLLSFTDLNSLLSIDDDLRELRSTINTTTNLIMDSST